MTQRSTETAIVGRVVELLERLESAEPWHMTHDELEELVEELGEQAGELLEERRRQLIIAAVARSYDYS